MERMKERLTAMLATDRDARLNACERQQFIDELEASLVDTTRLKQYLKIVNDVLAGRLRFLEGGFLENPAEFDKLEDVGLAALDDGQLIQLAFDVSLLWTLHGHLAENVHSPYWSRRFGQGPDQHVLSGHVLRQSSSTNATDPTCLTGADRAQREEKEQPTVGLAHQTGVLPASLDCREETMDRVVYWSNLLNPRARPSIQTDVASATRDLHLTAASEFESDAGTGPTVFATVEIEGASCHFSEDETGTIFLEGNLPSDRKRIRFGGRVCELRTVPSGEAIRELVGIRIADLQTFLYRHGRQPEDHAIEFLP